MRYRIAQPSGILSHIVGNTFSSESKGYDSIFVTRNGYVTSYGPAGEFNWQVCAYFNTGRTFLLVILVSYFSNRITFLVNQFTGHIQTGMLPKTRPHLT